MGHAVAAQQSPWFRALYSGHGEDSLILYPGHARQGRVGLFRTSAAAWWNERPATMRINSQHSTHRGIGVHVTTSERSQRVIVKAVPTKSRGPASQSWYTHGVYLQREGINGHGHGRGFDATADSISISKSLSQWQRNTDSHMFKVIISPEQSHRLNLQEYARTLMTDVQQDLGTQLQWVGIGHYNTTHPHLHLLIRGRDEQGQPLLIQRDYLNGGLKERAQAVATRLLGVRTMPEMLAARERAIHGRRWTFLDEQIRHKMDGRLVHDRRLTAHERGRLEELERRGLAWKEDDSWELSRSWERLQLVEEPPPPAHDRERPPTREQPPPRGRDRDQQREREQQHERDTEDERQRILRIDELEHDLGWSRS